MALLPIAGSEIFIGLRVAAKTNVTLNDFVGHTWTKIDGWASAGTLGDAQNVIEQELISDSRVTKIKGTRNAGNMENSFVPLPGDPGQQILRTAMDDCAPYSFKIEWGAACAIESPVTISVATPGVITATRGHGFDVGSPVLLTPTGGDLPAGLAANTVYYVVASGLTATTFSVAATPGGAAIATTGAGDADSILVTGQPAGETDYFYGLAMPGGRASGGPNTARTRTWTIAPISNIVEV